MDDGDKMISEAEFKDNIKKPLMDDLKKILSEKISEQSVGIVLETYNGLFDIGFDQGKIYQNIIIARMVLDYENRIKENEND